MVEHYRNKEELLITAVKSGDRKAFGELYDKYAPLLFGVIKKNVPDPKLAEEILQELFITIWNKIGSFDSSRQYLYNWMHTLAKELIVKNLSLSSSEEVAKTEKVNSYVDIEIPGTANSEMPSGKIFDLIYFKGYSYEEVARELKISVAILQTNIRTELNHLRGTLVK